MTDLDYWINIYKPINITSSKAVLKIKKKFNIPKIGHAGTLDPNAEGILPVAVGKATKLIHFIQDQVKKYEFVIKWGEQTTTDDRDGDIINKSKNIPNEDSIKNILKNLTGNIMQKPPKVSAVKIKGKRAYKRFFEKDFFDTKERIVKIYNLKFLNQINSSLSKISVECGKGFYVRSLARDLGEILHTKAHIYSLKRTKVGNFTDNNSILLDDLLKIRQMAIGNKGFHSSISVLDDIPAFEIETDEMLKDISHGKKVRVNFLKTLPLVHKIDDFCFAKRDDKIISFGKIEENYFKPKKVLY